MLKTALRAQLPLIACTTRDLVNFEAVLGYVSGRSPVRITGAAFASDAEARKLAGRVDHGAVLWTTEPVTHLDVLYRRLVVQDATLVIVNPEDVPEEAFSAGDVPVPRQFVASELQQADIPDGVIESIMPGLAGLTMKEVGEVVRLAEARDGVLDLDSVTTARRRAFTQVRGLSLLDTRLPYYLPDAQVEQYLGWAREFFLRRCDQRLKPRGLLLSGPPGTGKTTAARHVARELGVPLLRLDLGAIRDKYVGESELALRAAFTQAEREGPCVLLLDEAEKVLAGREDSGVTSLLLDGTLWWMAEHRAEVLVVLTTNAFDSLPPELYRPGRVDECLHLSGLPDGPAVEAFVRSLLGTYDVEGLPFRATASGIRRAVGTYPAPQATVEAEVKGAVRRHLLGAA